MGYAHTLIYSLSYRVRPIDPQGLGQIEMFRGVKEYGGDRRGAVGCGAVPLSNRVSGGCPHKKN